LSAPARAAWAPPRRPGRLRKRCAEWVERARGYGKKNIFRILGEQAENGPRSAAAPMPTARRAPSFGCSRCVPACRPSWRALPPPVPVRGRAARRACVPGQGPGPLLYGQRVCSEQGEFLGFIANSSHAAGPGFATSRKLRQAGLVADQHQDIARAQNQVGGRVEVEMAIRSGHSARGRRRRAMHSAGSPRTAAGAGRRSRFRRCAVSPANRPARYPRGSRCTPAARVTTS